MEYFSIAVPVMGEYWNNGKITLRQPGVNPEILYMKLNTPLNPLSRGENSITPLLRGDERGV
jgi:hypothetical protein